MDDLDTPITRPARRITRALNSSPAAVLHYFDAEGNELHGHDAGLVYINSEDFKARTEGYVIAAIGARGALRGKYAYREVQDLLDHGGDEVTLQRIAWLREERRRENGR